MLKGVQGDITFNIVGPFEDPKYVQTCRKVCEDLAPNINVCFHGEVDHVRVHEILSSNHLFFLPTRGENFGHVILEALLAGCPILLSDQTPWKGLENFGIGWDIPLNHPENKRRWNSLSLPNTCFATPIKPIAPHRYQSGEK